MLTLLSALGRALRDLAQPRVLAVLVLPMLGAILLWSVLAFFFWDAWLEAFRSFAGGTSVARWLEDRGATWVLDSLGIVLVIGLLLPATIITAVMVTELVAMPVIVAVAGRSYPMLEKRSGGTLAGSLVNALTAVALFAVVWLVTLPLWLSGIGAVVLPALNSAWLNQKLFRYDALAEHASREEYVALVKCNRSALFALGLMLAPLYYVPIVNLAAPVVSGLAFTHFCLALLSRQRRGDEKK